MAPGPPLAPLPLTRPLLWRLLLPLLLPLSALPWSPALCSAEAVLQGGFPWGPQGMGLLLAAGRRRPIPGPSPNLPAPFIFLSHGPNTDEPHKDREQQQQQEQGKGSTRHFNATSPPYFERSYSTGWFTSPVILNTHVESSQLYTLLTQRRRTHYPGYITAHCVERPATIVLFNILWVPNANNWKWSTVFNVEGPELQSRLTELITAGQFPSQIDSYAYVGHGTIYYSAIFVAKEKWAAGSEVNVRFGLPNDVNYCCGPSSRTASLQRAGMKPLSVALVQDPASRDVYVTDVWITRDSAFWQSGIDKRSGELQSILAALAPPLIPVFVKSYRVTHPNGAFEIFHSYVAESDSSVTSFAATVDVSRSGMELLAKTLKYPPLFVSSFFLEGEIDPQDPSSGDMYVAVWQGVSAAAGVGGSGGLLELQLRMRSWV